MSILISDCPHCRAQSVTFDVIGTNVTTRLIDGRPFAIIAGVCRHCGLPIVTRWEPEFDDNPQMLAQRVGQIVQMQAAFTNAGLILQQTWPTPPPAQVPQALPPDVERALLQAEHNFLAPGCEEAAAMMYRRALEIGIKVAYPSLKVSLR